MASIKQKRLESIIRKNISDIIQFELKDPHVGFVTITDVWVSNDHSYAKVFCLFLGDKDTTGTGLKALNRAKGFIRTELSQRLDIRRTPELIFMKDTSEDKGRRIDAILDEIAKSKAEEE